MLIALLTKPPGHRHCKCPWWLASLGAGSQTNSRQWSHVVYAICCSSECHMPPLLLSHCKCAGYVVWSTGIRTSSPHCPPDVLPCLRLHKRQKTPFRVSVRISVSKFFRFKWSYPKGISKGGGKSMRNMSYTQFGNDVRGVRCPDIQTAMTRRNQRTGSGTLLLWDLSLQPLRTFKFLIG